MSTLLCINGSDSSGHSGIQSDIRAAGDLGVTVYTAVTSVTVQNSSGIKQIHELPPEVVVGQVRSVYEEQRPQAVKVGMVNDPETIRGIRQEIMGCRSVVCSPGILASSGGCLMSNEALHALIHELLPITHLVMMKCTDAEILLGRRITSDEDMQRAAAILHEMGAEWVMLRGGSFIAGRVNALLSGGGERSFFSSVNIEGWSRHGVGGALSTAVAARLALGDDVPMAIQKAHTYIHGRMVHAVENKGGQRSAELYNRFLSLLAAHYSQAHDVAFYASELAIGTRYLSQITAGTVGKSPKQIIDDYLLQQCKNLLQNTSMSIQEISDHLGFSSPIFFARFVKQREGVSPREWRKETFSHHPSHRALISSFTTT